MFLSLADLAPSVFESKAQAIVLGSLTFDADLVALEKIATGAVAVPVLEAISSLRSAQDKAKALVYLVSAAHHEDVATAQDRIRNEDLIDRRMDQLASSIKDWNAARSGIGGGARVLWDRLSGGADLTSFDKSRDSVLVSIKSAPLTQEGRERLSKRLPEVMAAISPGDWRYLVAVGVGVLVWNAAKAKAASLAQAKAAEVATRLHERVRKRAKKPD